MARIKKLTNLHVLMAVDVLGIAATPPVLAETLGIGLSTMYRRLKEMYKLKLLGAIHISDGPSVHFVTEAGRTILYREYHGNY